MTQPEPKDAVALLTEMTQEPTLDEYMRRDPHSLTRDDFRMLVDVLRKERALVNIKQERRALKKETGDSDDDE